MTAAARYGALSAARSTVLDRARAASRLTIPGLIPEDGQNEHSSTTQPWQSVGARCVAHLSSALLLALFPPNLPFFRLTIDEATAEQLGEQLGEANAKLAKIARSAYGLMESSNLRPVMMEGLRHLIVAGNVLVYTPIDKPARLYRIDQYVVKRNSSGEMLEAVVCEKTYPSALSPEVRAAVGLEDPKASEQEVEVYTHIIRDGDTVRHHQEIKNVIVPGSAGQAPADKCGWLPLRWLAVPGSDYGRSQCTEYIGDFMSLEDLWKSMVQFAAVASRIVHIVDPNSGIDIDELAEAESGDFISGYKDRISTLQLDKYADWQVMSSLAERLETRLSAAFLLRSGLTRDAERVTAEEVRMVAQELENVLGGTYTILSAELQLPLTRRFLHVGSQKQLFPPMPKTIIPMVVTGFDALGRAHSVNRLRAFIADLKAALGDQEATAVLNADEVARRLGEGNGVDGLDDLLKSPEDQAAEAQQSQMSAALQASAPQLAKGVTEAALAQPQEPA